MGASPDGKLVRLLAASGAVLASLVLHAGAVATVLLLGALGRLVPPPAPTPSTDPSPTFFEVVRLAPPTRPTPERQLPPNAPESLPAAPAGGAGAPSARRGAHLARLAARVAPPVALLLAPEAALEAVAVVVVGASAGEPDVAALGGPELGPGSGSGSGSSSGPAGPGTAGEGGGAPAADVTGEISRRLGEAAAGCYPRVATRLRAEGVAKVHFCVDPVGQPAGVTLVASAGFTVLDEAALGCVLTRAAPLPRTTECLTVPIRFRLGAGP